MTDELNNEFSNKLNVKSITYQDINKIINTQYCNKTFTNLSDSALLTEYKKQPSVIKKINKYRKILENHKIAEDEIKNILEDFMLELIPPGTKGAIRGCKFNKIIEKILVGLNLDSEKFDVQFEKQHADNKVDEIPDWFIYERETKKLIIGMNQLDLWSGGQQSNRGMKYMKTENKSYKLLCVVCNKIQLHSNKNKKYKLFKMGFENNTLCYIGGLKNIIYEYFDIEQK